MYISISIPKNNVFVRNGLNLLMDFPIDALTATFGGEIEVFTPWGKIKTVIPSGTYTGSTKTIQGHGIHTSSKDSCWEMLPCALQEDTINFELQRPIKEELYELFKPFGHINTVLGNARLGEVFVVGLDGSIQLKLQGKK